MTNDSSKPSIPEWQRASAPTSSSTDSAEQQPEQQQQQQQQPDADRSALLKQAETFLSDPEIRDATTSRKITFLESKGLTNDEIDSLLGVSRNKDADSSDNTSSSETKSAAHIESNTSSATAVSTAAPSTSTPSTTTRDVPPIITYPEFLVNASAQHKPPLLSLQGVLYTLYGAAGLGATIYGASEYVVKPMLNTLSSARHDLAETALTNLSTLNEKLEQNVSKIPVHISALGKREREDDETDESESITSDPTEVFHRDIATQTSPDLLNNSDTAVSSDEKNDESDSHKVVDSQTQNIAQLTSHLRSFISNLDAAGEFDHSMSEQISGLQTYVDGLSYSSYNSYLNSSTMYNNYFGSSSGGSKEEDAISSFRADIRGVKGALLSARNFPSGRPTGLTR